MKVKAIYVPEQNHCATYREDTVSATLQTRYHFGGGGDAALILEEKTFPVICLQANGIDRCDTAGCNGCGFSEGGVAYTLNTIDRHAVCFPVDSFWHDERSTQFSRGGCCDTLTSSDHKQPIVVAYEKPADMSCEVYDARGNGEGGVAPTLTGDHQNRITDYTAILAIEARHEEPRCYEDGVSPAIIARAGTGGGVIPRWFSWKPACVMGSTCWNAPFTDGKVVPTICARAGTGGNQLPLVVLKRNEE